MSIDHSGHLEEILKQLEREMSRLNTSRDKVTRSGELRMDMWLNDVKKKVAEVHDITKRFDEVMNRTFSHGKSKLKEAMIECRRTIIILIARGNEISELIESFMTEVATTRLLRYSHLQIEDYICKPKTEIGSGEFGKVYKENLPNGVQVAVKILHSTLLIKDMEKQFIAEVGIMGKTYHRNLVRLYGFCFEAEMKAFVYEYMEGSLEQILDQNQYKVEWACLYGVAVGTTKALSYLREHCDHVIIHRDIKLCNVLLEKDNVPKITDFGLARLYSTDKSQAATTMLKGTHSYDAPEVRMGMYLTYKCDVYSYGMMLFDILRRGDSEDKKGFAKRVWEKFEKRELDKIMEECGIEEMDTESAKRLFVIALCCIQDFADDRPSMSTVLKILERELQLPSPRNPFGFATSNASHH